jgi:rhamnosyltransferase
MKNILFFIHYNKYNLLLDYVVFLLEHLDKIYDKIVFISRSMIPGERQDLLSNLCYKTIYEYNSHDYLAWKNALLAETWENLSGYDTLTLMNDAWFGPIFELNRLFEKPDADFWDLAGLFEIQKNQKTTKKPAPEYIQNHFVCFKQNVIQSSAFRIFWDNVKPKKKNGNSVQKYKTRLDSALIRAGFKHSFFYDAEFSGSDPEFVIKHKIPFIDINTFLHHRIPYHVIQLMENNTNYPLSLVKEYFFKMYPPNTSLSIYDGCIAPSQNNTREKELQKIAVHLHVYYLDIFERYIGYFNDWNFKFDLYITTDSFSKKQKIEEYTKTYLKNNQSTEIIVNENRGRDVLPWLMLSDKLAKYDIAGHFHTKKTLHEETWLGLVWQKELFNMLLVRSDDIIDAFYNDPDVGIIIPDVPACFHAQPYIFLDEGALKKALNKLWTRMRCKKSIHFDRLLAFVMSFGNMFWYRPAALKPLFDLNLSREDFPNEPIPGNSIAHCIERITAYVAWDSGYDYRIVQCGKPLYNGLLDNAAINRYAFNVRNTIPNRTARILFYFPKLLKGLLVNLIKIRHAS